MLGAKLTIVVLDNRGFGCINRLQMATGGANFNNLLKDTQHVTLPEYRLRHACGGDGAVRAQGRGRLPSLRRGWRRRRMLIGRR